MNTYNKLIIWSMFTLFTSLYCSVPKDAKDTKATASSTAPAPTSLEDVKSSKELKTEQDLKKYNEEHQNDDIVVIVEEDIIDPKTGKNREKEHQKFKRKFLLHSHLFKTTLEGDKEAKELSVKSQLLGIPLTALQQFLVGLEVNLDDQNMQQYIKKYNPLAVLKAAHYLDIKQLIDLTIPMIADEFLANSTDDKWYNDWLAQMTGPLKNFEKQIILAIMKKAHCLNFQGLPNDLGKADHYFHKEGARYYSVSPNGEYIVVIYNINPSTERIEIYKLNEEKLIAAINDSPITDGLTWSPDNTTIFLMYRSGEQRLYNIHSGYMKNKVSRRFDWAWNNNYYDEYKIHEGNTGDVLKDLPNVGYCLGGNSSKILVKLENEKIAVIDMKTDKVITLQDLDEHNRVNYFSHDSRFIAYIGSIAYSTHLFIYDAKNGRLIAKIRGDNYCWSPYTSIIATSSKVDKQSSIVIDMYNVSEQGTTLITSIQTQLNSKTPFDRIQKFYWSPHNTLILETKDGTYTFDLQSRTQPFALDQLRAKIKACMGQQALPQADNKQTKKTSSASSSQKKDEKQEKSAPAKK
jgi:WD40 repeat protein